MSGWRQGAGSFPSCFTKVEVPKPCPCHRLSVQKRAVLLCSHRFSTLPNKG